MKKFFGTLILAFLIAGAAGTAYAACGYTWRFYDYDHYRNATCFEESHVIQYEKGADGEHRAYVTHTYEYTNDAYYSCRENKKEILYKETCVPETKYGYSASCLKSGLTDGSCCSLCKQVLVEQERIPATGHTPVNEPGFEATCTAPGKTAGQSCGVCGEVLLASEEIPARGHVEVVDTAVNATCTTGGLTKGSHCSRCNRTLVQQEEVPAKGHSYKETDRVEPTATKDGWVEYRCSNCGDTYEETLSAQGTPKPTATPTSKPTATPTSKPTATPTSKPTATPTPKPTATPTPKPTATPTSKPTATPTPKPTATPTPKPTATPTPKPTATATNTVKPTATARPTIEPTEEVVATATPKPTATPTMKPTVAPTPVPTATPTVKPTVRPTARPTAAPVINTVKQTATTDSVLYKTGMITGDVVNVRAQAGTGYDVVAKVVEYSVLDVVDEVQGQDGYIWYLVNVDGKVGYVRGDLIEITEPILPLVKQEEIGQRTLMEASAAIAQQLSQASIEIGMSPRILNIEKILTAEELEDVSKLPIGEQMAVLLSVIGHEDAVKAAITAETLTLSDEAMTAMDNVMARIHQMPDNEKAFFKMMNAQLFLVKQAEIDGVMTDCFSLEVLIELNGKEYVERYTFCYDSVSESWMLYQVDARESTEVSL